MTTTKNTKTAYDMYDFYKGFEQLITAENKKVWKLHLIYDEVADHYFLAVQIIIMPGVAALNMVSIGTSLQLKIEENIGFVHDGGEVIVLNDGLDIIE